MKRISLCLLITIVTAGHAAEPVEMARRAEELKSLRWGMFICWSFSTFSGKEWTPGVKDVSFFRAKDADTDQWARTAKEARMGYILFLTKHHDGFCLWDTKTTDRKVTKAPLGRDVLAELWKSCDKYGVKLALYYSESEWAWPGGVPGKGYRNGSNGRNPEMKKAQLRELLTQYGPIEYIWFDHAVGDGGLSHADTIAWCKSFQPGCFVGFNNGDQEGADIRLGEMGKPGPLADHKAAGPHMRDAPSKSYRLAEFTYPILPPHQGGARWFYSLPRHNGLCRSAESLYQDYLGAAKYGNIFSLDVGPDYDGKLRKIDVETLRKVGQMIKTPPPQPELKGKPKPAGPDGPKHRADWMRRGTFGVMVHWLVPGTAPEKGGPTGDFDRAVNAFDVDRFVKQFQETGADWLIFTIGQNTSRYASPNAVLDRLAGPGHCSKRDLALEIAQRMHKIGKRFIAYLPSEVNAPRDLHAPFAWNPKDQSEFQRRYTQFIREYALRFGTDLDGWWFDGCYKWPVFPNHTYNWPLWFAAARAGNPQAAVAFNDGTFAGGVTTAVTPLQDYLSGEVGGLVDGHIRVRRKKGKKLYLPSGPFVEGTEVQWHALVPIDCHWIYAGPGPMPPPKYSDADLFRFVKSCKAVGGAVTLNVGIYQEGHLAKASVAQLGRLAATLKGPDGKPAGVKDKVKDINQTTKELEP